MVFTRCGLIWDPNNPMAPPQRVLKPESIRRECDASLQQVDGWIGAASLELTTADLQEISDAIVRTAPEKGRRYRDWSVPMPRTSRLSFTCRE
jgi:hypothetical protein